MPALAPNPRPLWLLDIDGVLLPDLRGRHRLDTTAWREWHHATIVDQEGKAYEVSWSPVVVEAVRHAIESGVEVQFLSTWLSSSPAVTEALGLPTIPWLDFDPSPTVTPWPKLLVARNEAANRPLLWTDDHIVSEAGAEDWVKQRRASTLWFAPQLRIGLTQRMVREIREWTDRHAPAPTATPDPSEEPAA